MLCYAGIFRPEEVIRISSDKGVKFLLYNQVVASVQHYCTYSFRSGGATMAANSWVCEIGFNKNNKRSLFKFLGFPWS